MNLHVDADERFIYQQVADNTLIAHRADDFQDPGDDLIGMDRVAHDEPYLGDHDLTFTQKTLKPV